MDIYTLSWESSNVGFFQATASYYDAEKQFIVMESFQGGAYSHTYTAPDGAAYVRFAWSVAVNDLDAIRENIRLNVGENDLGYEQYVPSQTFTISLPQAAGTVYGGELTIYESGTGKLVVNKAYVDIGTVQLDGAWGAADPSWDSVNFRVLGMPEVWDDSSYAQHMMASMRTASALNLGRYQTARLADGKLSVSFRKADLINYGYDGSTAQSAIEAAYAYEAALTKKDEVIYPIAPLTYDLSAAEVNAVLTSLKGTNNIWADTGDILYVRYHSK